MSVKVFIALLLPLAACIDTVAVQYRHNEKGERYVVLRDTAIYMDGCWATVVACRDTVYPDRQVSDDGRRYVDSVYRIPSDSVR